MRLPRPGLEQAARVQAAEDLRRARKDGEHVRADGATYNFRAFLGMIGFEWRRADNFARKFVKERPTGTSPTARTRICPSTRARPQGLGVAEGSQAGALQPGAPSARIGNERLQL